MRGFAAGLVVVCIALISLRLGNVSAQDDAARPEFYSQKVRPILQTNCGSCHLGTNHRGGLSLNTRESMLKGGHDGTILVPGDPSKSLLVRLIRHEGPANDPMPMPPRKPKISDQDIATITAWVKAGAVMPTN
jgi:cytochrome c